MANYFEWDPSKYGLGVAEMDREHQNLIELMNKLHVLHTANAPTEKLAGALQDLAKYTVKHFADEEAYMARVRFSELDRHKAVHADLLRRVGEYVTAFKSSGKLNAEFFSFLRFWLKAHICNIDTKYAKHAAVA